MTASDPWLMIACCVGGAAGFGLVVRHAARMKRRYEARLAEQDRIAREMHDWLLQSTLGLMLRFHAVSRTHTLEGRTRQMLEHTLDQANRFIDRERLQLDRTHAPLDTSAGLVDALTAIGRELAAACPETFNLVVEGTARSLEPAALDSACRIGRDLLVGAYAQPEVGPVRVRIAFARAGLNLRLCVGAMAFDSALSAARLRACVLGATVEVWRRLGGGTEIDLHVPATIAYGPRVGGLRRFRLRWPRWPRSRGLLLVDP